MFTISKSAFYFRPKKRLISCGKPALNRNKKALPLCLIDVSPLEQFWVISIVTMIP